MKVPCKSHKKGTGHQTDCPWFFSFCGTENTRLPELIFTYAPYNQGCLKNLKHIATKHIRLNMSVTALITSVVGFTQVSCIASYSGQVDEFGNPMKSELKTRPCLKPVFEII